MKKPLIIIAISLCILAVGVYLRVSRPVEKTITPIVSVKASPKAVPPPPTTAELLRLVNIERAKVNVAPLVEDSRLDQSAQRKADDMMTYNYYGHISPHDGKQGYQYINDVGIYCKTDSENIKRNGPMDNTSVDTIHGFVISKPHYMAMINPDNQVTGFGIAISKNVSYVVEHFCQT